MTQTVGEVRQGGYGPRPRTLAPRSTEAERAAHAEFIAKVVKSDLLWKRLGLETEA